MDAKLTTELRAAAIAEADRMLESTSDADPACQVQMVVSQFRRLATLLKDLADTSPGDRGAADWLDPGEGGSRVWIPISYYESQRNELAELQGRYSALSAKSVLDSLHV